jgi:hypothetical protein
MDPVIDLAVRAALGLLFASAALHKLRDPRRFTATLAEYRLLPARLAPGAAVGVMVAECGIVVALVVWPAWGAAAGAALLCLYGSAIGVNLARGRRHIDCGCGGPAARRDISGWLAARNALAAAVALAAALLPVATRELVWLDACTVVAGTAMLAACWSATDHLLALAPGLARLREAA